MHGHCNIRCRHFIPNSTTEFFGNSDEKFGLCELFLHDRLERGERHRTFAQLDGALTSQESPDEVLAAARRADAHREAGLFRPAALRPTAAAETGGLADSAGLLKRDAAAADRARHVAGTVENDNADGVGDVVVESVSGSLRRRREVVAVAAAVAVVAAAVRVLALHLGLNTRPK